MNTGTFKPPMGTKAQPQKANCICANLLRLGLRQLNGTRSLGSTSGAVLLTVENLMACPLIYPRGCPTARNDLGGHMWLLCLLWITCCPSAIWRTSKTGAGDTALADSRSEEKCQGSGAQFLVCRTSGSFLDIGMLGKPSKLGCRVGSSPGCLATVFLECLSE